VDFIGGLPKAQGKDSILVVVLSAHFFALSHPFSAKTIAELFVKKVVCLHGFPATIVLDRYPLFISFLEGHV